VPGELPKKDGATSSYIEIAIGESLLDTGFTFGSAASDSTASLRVRVAVYTRESLRGRTRLEENSEIPGLKIEDERKDLRRE
jgi:hypothetical protein